VKTKGPISTDLVVRWALTTTGRSAQAARRYAAVQTFARHLAVFDPDIEVPPVGLLGSSARPRVQPHIYSNTEIAELLGQSRLLLPSTGLRPVTYVAVFSLLTATGLRLSEVCRLESADVDLSKGVLTVRESKFRKSRLVPLHPTTAAALRGYVAERDSRLGPCRSGGFLRTDRAEMLKPNTVERTFARLRQRLGWTADGRARRPRIHDLRHSFAVRRLLVWHEQGADLDRKILALSTCLGHARPSDTYWYLTAVPELMAVTSRRFEDFAQAAQGDRS
jgi:integrase